MTDLDKRIDSILRIDRSDIKELWSTGRFGTIAVPADRYKQYYDTIVGLQAELAARDKLVRKSYGEGYSHGRTTKAGEVNHFWHESKAKAALTKSEEK